MDAKQCHRPFRFRSAHNISLPKLTPAFTYKKHHFSVVVINQPTLEVRSKLDYVNIPAMLIRPATGKAPSTCSFLPYGLTDQSKVSSPQDTI